MNIKQKLIVSLISLTGLGLSAAEKVAPDPFTAYGNSWIEIDAGASIYSGTIASQTDVDAGAAIAIKGNVHIIELFRIGLDIGYSFAIDDINYAAGDFRADATAYTGELEAKAYAHLLKMENLGLTLFLSPFASYTYTDINARVEGTNYRYHKDFDACNYGVRIGFEIGFFNDFYLAPSYRYSHLEPIDSATTGADLSIAELEFGWRLSYGTSIHLNYAHVLEDEFEGIDISTDKITVGVRYTF